MVVDKGALSVRNISTLLIASHRFTSPLLPDGFQRHFYCTPGHFAVSSFPEFRAAICRANPKLVSRFSWGPGGLTAKHIQGFSYYATFFYLQYG
jgi:hypothetical protein